jgi:hypothetical protein
MKFPRWSGQLMNVFGGGAEHYTRGRVPSPGGSVKPSLGENILAIGAELQLIHPKEVTSRRFDKEFTKCDQRSV